MSTLSQCVHGLDPLSQFRDRELVLLFLELIAALMTLDATLSGFPETGQREIKTIRSGKLVLVILPITNQTNQNKPTKPNQPNQNPEPIHQISPFES